ncbi:MAG: hypothetical protein ACYDCJ_08880 [Gammaproteobacteria bacterium]
MAMITPSRIEVGRRYGASAAQYWADQYVQNSGFEAALDYGMGLYTSLWTPCTSDTTAMFVVAGGSGAVIRGGAAAVDAIGVNSGPWAKVAWFSGNLMTAQPVVDPAATVFAPSIDVVQQAQNIQAVSDGINAEIEGSALNPTEIVSPPPKP